MWDQSEIVNEHRSGAREESRPETVGGGCQLAIPGLDPGIPAGMTARWVLPCVLGITGGTRSPSLRLRVIIHGPA